MLMDYALGSESATALQVQVACTLYGYAHVGVEVADDAWHNASINKNHTSIGTRSR